MPGWAGSGRPGRDLALAGASLIGGLAVWGAGLQPQFPWAPDVPRACFLLPLLAVSVAVGLRRVATRTGLAVGTGAVLADAALGVSVGSTVIYTQVLYDTCVYGPPPLRRWLLRVTVGLSVGSTALGLLVWGFRGAAVGVPFALLGVLPVVTGVSVRQYRDQASAERARAEQTARLVELDRRQAVLAERARMARELHDVVANHLSAVALHATAVLAAPGLDRPRVDAALRVIRESSVQGMAEMRQVIGFLREPSVDPAQEATRVRLDELDQLLDRMAAAGLRVRTTVEGRSRELPVGVDLAAYRIVQESLTNALRHGRGTAELTVAYRPTEVVVTVENPVGSGGAGASAAVGAGLPGGGAGLIGMRERATLLDGQFTGGLRDGCWRVRAALPTGASG
ncbi:sensor histidine kinase [Micromonospora sp. RL09-050-HVF-A]|uniref:sensor histidine kinase n=1 Tax=Micromonospora sp. RL09-050-HVF-A TaxID=1703433 RepID=UPI001C607532|nr:histidine kinase [Micromonospora sp. RL09-050-HVF-A]MBW4702548.1 two-component sensor histidine kinase [Micromonospora sp. RL09-050-HVF-A]